MWSKLHESLSIIPSREANAHCRPDDVVLDAFERDHAVRLPKGYREFIKFFGAGELGENYRIAGPGYPSLVVSWSPNIAEVNQRWHADDETDATYGSRDLKFYQSMFYFCETTEGEAIGWNTAELTGSDDAEYRIYIRMRSDDFIPLAESFAEFVSHICLGDGYDKVMTAHGYEIESPSVPSATFVPASCTPD